MSSRIKCFHESVHFILHFLTGYDGPLKLDNDGPIVMNHVHVRAIAGADLRLNLVDTRLSESDVLIGKLKEVIQLRGLMMHPGRVRHVEIRPILRLRDLEDVSVPLKPF